MYIRRSCACAYRLHATIWMASIASKQEERQKALQPHLISSEAYERELWYRSTRHRDTDPSSESAPTSHIYSDSFEDQTRPPFVPRQSITRAIRHLSSSSAGRTPSRVLVFVCMWNRSEGHNGNGLDHGGRSIVGVDRGRRGDHVGREQGNGQGGQCESHLGVCSMSG